MIPDTDLAYLAGLFDGEGSVYYKQLKQTRHNRPGKPVHKVWSIRMEIAMTEQSIIRWVHEILKVGSVNKKPRSGFRKNGTRYLLQWRWRCAFRDAYYVARLLWPYAQVKLQGIEKIMDHYAPDYIFEDKVVSLQQYKEAMSLE